MPAFDPAAFQRFVLAGVEPKAFDSIKPQIPGLVEDFIRYDLHFMRLTGFLAPNDTFDNGEYDEDEAFEYIYDACLSDRPGEEDESMVIASLLNRYMDLQYDYLSALGQER